MLDQVHRLFTHERRQNSYEGIANQVIWIVSENWKKHPFLCHLLKVVGRINKKFNSKIIRSVDAIQCEHRELRNRELTIRTVRLAQSIEMRIPGEVNEFEIYMLDAFAALARLAGFVGNLETERTREFKVV